MGSNNRPKNGRPIASKRNRCPFCGCSKAEHQVIRDVIVRTMKYYNVEDTAANRLIFVDQLVGLIEAAMPPKKEGDA